MIQCPYCLYQNIANVAICGNCKNDLPTETPSRKLLSYASQSMNTGLAAPQPDRSPITSAGSTSQPSIPQTDWMYAPPPDLIHQLPISQPGYMYASPPDAAYQPPAPYMFTPLPDMKHRSPISQASQMYTTMPEPAYQPPVAQASQMYGALAEPAPQPVSQASPLPIVQMGTVPARILLSSRRAFAGYGIFLRHRSFVLPNAGAQADRILRAIGEISSQRNSSLQLRGKNLREHGFQAEERYYLTLRRRASTVFVYVVPAGDDLYISRSTSVLCPINLGRIFALLLMLIAICIPFLLLPGVMTSIAHSVETIYGIYGNTAHGASVNSGFSAPVALGMAVLLGALTIFCAVMNAAMLIWYLVCSIIYWLREKDFLVYLRSLFLKDFEMDDIMLLEHITDMTIRTAVDKIGLDASLITPPEGGYQQERRIGLL